MSQADKEREQWKLFLGELILQFASIESLVLDVLVADEDSYEAGEDRFKKRAKVAIAKVIDSGAPSLLKEDLVGELERAIALASQRNAYVHNPLYERLEWILKETELVHQIAPPKRKRPLTIRDLQRDVEKTVSCAERLYVLVGSYDYALRGSGSS